MKIEDDEIKLALTSPDYDPSLVIVIHSPSNGTWSCAYATPLQAIAIMERMTALGHQEGGVSPAQCGDALRELVANGKTAIVKYWTAPGRFEIILQGYDTEFLSELRSTVSFS